jgi:hypothetical protein
VRGGRWHVVPDQEIDVNSVMKNCLRFYSKQSILEGALIYNIQRKHAKYDKISWDKSKQVQLLVVWRGEQAEGLYVHAVLVEHSERLDRDKLMRLHKAYQLLLKARVDLLESNWLFYGATVLATTIKAMNRGCGWDILISKGIKNNIERPLWINAKR